MTAAPRQAAGEPTPPRPWRVGRIVRSPISTSSGWSIAKAIARATAEARDVIVLISWSPRLDDAELDARGPRLLPILVDGLRGPRPPRRTRAIPAGAPSSRLIARHRVR
ncbi:hypothetical protein ACQEU6_26165 [Spirillospora sp. CA-108201]